MYDANIAAGRSVAKNWCPTSNTCRPLARDHAAPEHTLLLTKALQPW
jgi:hypothetical protein